MGLRAPGCAQRWGAGRPVSTSGVLLVLVLPHQRPEQPPYNAPHVRPEQRVYNVPSGSACKLRERSCRTFGTSGSAPRTFAVGPFPVLESQKVPQGCADPLIAGGDAVGGIGVEMPRFGCGAARLFSAGFCGREARNRQHSTLRGPALGLDQESHGTGQESTSGNLGRRLKFSRRLGVRRRVPTRIRASIGAEKRAFSGFMRGCRRGW